MWHTFIAEELGAEEWKQIPVEYYYENEIIDFYVYDYGNVSLMFCEQWAPKGGIENSVQTLKSRWKVIDLFLLTFNFTRLVSYKTKTVFKQCMEGRYYFSVWKNYENWMDHNHRCDTGRAAEISSTQSWSWRLWRVIFIPSQVSSALKPLYKLGCPLKKFFSGAGILTKL